MIEVTEAAKDAIKRAQTGVFEGFMFRLGIRTGGCAGLSYEMLWDRVGLQDSVLRFDDVCGVVMDTESEALLEGAILDHNVMNGFIIDNPNQSRGCGCGKSFS